MRFTDSDVGLYGDEQYGQAHVRWVMSELIIQHCPRLSCGAHDTYLDLRSDPTDSHREETAGLELLNKQTAEGLVWYIDLDGNLILGVESEVMIGSHLEEEVRS